MQPYPSSPAAFLVGYAREVQAIANILQQMVVASVPGVLKRVALDWQVIGYRVLDGPHSRNFCFGAPLAHTDYSCSPRISVAELIATARRNKLSLFFSNSSQAGSVIRSRCFSRS